MAAPLKHDVSLDGSLVLHPKVSWLPFVWDRPLALMADGSVVTVDDIETHRSADGGLTWNSNDIWPYHPRWKSYKPSREMSILATKAGSLVVGCMNMNENVWFPWSTELNDNTGVARLPQIVFRSNDGGVTWERPQTLHYEWTGEVRDLIQLESGRLVLSSMRMVRNPGRHTVLTYVSDDDGVTWRNAQIIDLGGQGHHGGVMEAAIEQLKDGRVWMLIRTNWGRCWEAFSYDDGLTWREIRPSAIEASTSPATIRRLQSGRLMLIWNRLTMEGKTEHALYGGDGIATEVAVSNQRRELSIAFSEDEGATFTKPVVLAALPDSTEEKIMLAYPRVMEYRPGEVWVTSMQGGLHCRFLEADFVG